MTSGCRRSLNLWANRIVPFRAHRMRLKVERLHDRLRNPAAGFEDAFKQTGSSLQTSLGGRRTDDPDPRLEGLQRAARPIQTDLGEQAVFDRIPFRASRRIVAARPGQTKLIAKSLLYLCLPQPRAAPIAAARISEHQNLARRRGLESPVFLPPPRDRRASELRRVGRHSHLDRTGVALQVVDAGRRRAPNGLGQELLHVTLDRLLPPGLAGLFELADQRFLFRVNADDRLTGRAKLGELLFDGFNLWVAIRMRCSGLFLVGVDTQRRV